jgi:hypothetical protein
MTQGEKEGERETQTRARGKEKVADLIGGFKAGFQF